MTRNAVGDYSRSHPDPWPGVEYFGVDCGVDFGSRTVSFSSHPTHVQFGIGPAKLHDMGGCECFDIEYVV